MCLAVPMKLIELADKTHGVTELNGTRYNVDLSLVADANVGDFLIVHAGFAIEKLDQEEADERLRLFDGMAAVWAEQDAAK
jgi:hydrogenase expression/formation protein HypC